MVIQHVTRTKGLYMVIYGLSNCRAQEGLAPTLFTPRRRLKLHLGVWGLWLTVGGGWMARVLSAAHHVPCRHLNPSVGVIATVRPAGPFNPTFTAPPEPLRARLPNQEEGASPSQLGSNLLTSQDSSPSRTQKPRR